MQAEPGGLLGLVGCFCHATPLSQMSNVQGTKSLPGLGLGAGKKKQCPTREREVVSQRRQEERETEGKQACWLWFTNLPGVWA